MNKIQSNRYVALDVLRGLTVAGMILVNNPGSWEYVYPPLRHAKWVGCTPTDLVFPFFLFIIGAAMAFSFSKSQHNLSVHSVKKLLIRGALIFIVGLGLNAFPFYPYNPNPEIGFWENIASHFEHLRVFGVLQRIAMCYVLGGFLALWLKSSGKIIVSMIALSLIYWIVLATTGNPLAEALNGAEGVFSLHGQNISSIDIALVGEKHVYSGYGVIFDPEGVIGTLTSTCTLLLGYIIGNLIRLNKNKTDVVSKLYTIGLLCVGSGIILDVWMPIIKALWTISYVLYTGGWSIIMLAMFIYFIDIKGREKIFIPFKAMGMNPLFAYVIADIMAKLFGYIITWSTSTTLANGEIVKRGWSLSSWFYENICITIVGANSGISSLIYSLTFVGIILAMTMYLYRKKIVIKL